MVIDISYQYVLKGAHTLHECSEWINLHYSVQTALTITILGGGGEGGGVREEVETREKHSTIRIEARDLQESRSTKSASKGLHQSAAAHTELGFCWDLNSQGVLAARKKGNQQPQRCKSLLITTEILGNHSSQQQQQEYIRTIILLHVHIQDTGWSHFFRHYSDFLAPLNHFYYQGYP